MAKRKPNGRFVKGAMLPALGVLTVIACAVGVQIGESAIGQIDPFYFRGGAPIPRDVTLDQHVPPGPTYAQASGFAEGRAALTEDCGPDCPAWTARQGGPASVAGPAYFDPAPLPPAPRYRDTAVADAGTIESSPQMPTQERLNRYLHYPVSQDQETVAASVTAESGPTAPLPGNPDGM